MLIIMTLIFHKDFGQGPLHQFRRGVILSCMEGVICSLGENDWGFISTKVKIKGVICA